MKVSGGQVVLEGVALRSNEWRVAVVRRASGELTVGTGPSRPSRFCEVPFLRGLVAWLVESPVENEWAATMLAEEADRADAGDASVPRDYRGSVPPVRREELPPARTRRPASVLIAIVLSQALPQVGAHLGSRALGIEQTPSTAAFQASISATATFALVLYLLAVRRLADIRRVFQYGAAFKQAFWAAMATEKPSAATLRRHPAWHPLGAPFGMALGAVLLAVLAALVLAFAPIARDGSLAAHGAACGVRILLVPVVIGVADEMQRAIAAAGHGTAVRLFFAPFIAVERLVAISPDDEHLTVAATALLELARLHAGGGAASSRASVQAS